MTLAHARQLEAGFIEKYGRKFTLAIIVTIVGLLVHLLGLQAVVVLDSVERAREVTEIVKAFREVIIAATFCFTGADALITWKTAQYEPHKAGPGPSIPRQSGTVSALEEGAHG
jgi:hypothetical protein